MIVPPRTVAGQQPEYSRLDPLTFQELCRDILQTESDLLNVQVYGRSGQWQRGIDILADRRSPPGLVAGQCKRVQVVTPPVVRGAIKEFLKFKDYWKSQGVDRFILFVSSDATDTKVHAEVSRQKRRLIRSGINFELWSDATLTSRLHAHRGLVTFYLTPEWADIICGGTVIVPSAALSTVSTFLVAQLEQVSVKFQSSIERILEGAREAWRAGRKTDARRVVDEYRDPQAWQTLTDGSKASICRLEGQLALDDGQIDRAKSLLSEAQSYGGAQTVRLEALILRAEGHREQAHNLLKNQPEPDSVTLDAAILLEMQDVDGALRRLAAVDDSADSHRIKAIARLLSGDVDQAEAEIKKARSLAPNWTINRFTEAVITYYSCLSPSRELAELPPWPEPIGWSYIKSDDESRSRLAVAARVFQDLQRETTEDLQLSRLLKTWELACTANDAVRRSQAEELCAGVLRDDPANEYCLVWAVARRLDVDQGSSRALLEQRARTVEGNAESVISLLICYLEEQNVEAADELIRSSRSKFAAIQQLSIWQFWLSQIQALAGKPAAEPVQQLPRNLRRLEIRAAARRTGEWSSLVALLEEDAAGEKLAKFELCALLATQGRWQDALQYADDLLESVHTTESLRLACSILFNTEQYSRCLETIEKHRSWFPQSKVPASFLQMKAAAERASGEIRSAIQTAEDALSIGADRTNYLSLAELYLESGDFASLSQLASRHMRYPDLTGDDLLRMAARLAAVDSRIGAGLWRRAVQKGIEDPQLGGAVRIGYDLALDKELAPLMARLVALPEGQGLQKVDVADLPKLLELGQKAANATYEQYRMGQACLAAALKVFGGDLSDWYNRRLADNQANQESQKPLYVRHGWRSRNEVLSGETDRLCADLTSLLLARRLGVLSKLIEAYKPIYIPHQSLLAIASMREATVNHQPSRKPAFVAMKSALDRNLIKVLGTKAAVTSSLQNVQDAVDVEADIIQVCALGEPLENSSLGTLIESAASLGAISTDRAKSFQECIQQSTAIGVLKRHQKVHVTVPDLESLARGEILREVAETFELYIDAAEASSITSFLDNVQKAERDADWLSSMIDELKVGLENRHYQLLPLLDVGQKEGIEDAPLALTCTLDLLHYEARSKDLIWIDDRSLNSFIHREGAKIVDTLDLLLGMHSRQLLGDEELFRVLDAYRACDIRFIALRKDEILYRLDSAVSANGEFRETAELRTMRLSYARAVADAQALRTIPTLEGQTLEWPFLLDSSAAVMQALQETWSRSQPGSAKEQKSEWLISHLYLPDRGRSSAVLTRTSESDLEMEAGALGGLLTSSLVGFGNDKECRQARRAYLDWLYHRVLTPRFESDPDLKDSALRHSTQLLQMVRPRKRSKRVILGAIATVTLGWLEDLPEEIRNRICSDTNVLTELGVRTFAAVTAGSSKFEASAFWEAAKEVLRTGKKVLLEASQLSIHHRNGLSFLTLEEIRTGEVSLLGEAPLEILSTRTAEKEAALNWIVSAYDLSSRDADDLRQILQGSRSPAETMEKVAEYRAQSATHFYQHLQGKIRRREGIVIGDVIPNDMCLLLRPLRLATGQSQDRPLRAMPDELDVVVQELEIGTALERLIRLPRPLSGELRKDLSTISKEERRAVLTAVLRTSRGNPVAISHLICLFFEHSEDYPAYGRLASRLLRNTTSGAFTTLAKALLRILRHIEGELWLASGYKTLPLHHRLFALWMHASRLLEVMVQVGVDPNWIAESFGANWNRLPAEVLSMEAQYWKDVAHPTRLDTSRLLLALIAYASCSGATLSSETRDEISEAWSANPGRVVELMFDTSREPNAMMSFLAESSWSGLFKEDTPAMYAACRSDDLLKGIAMQLLDGGDPQLWYQLHAQLKDASIPLEARATFSRLILETDFNQLAGAHETDLGVALVLASTHASDLGPEVVAKARRSILERAAGIAAEGRPIDDRVESTLLSAAFYLYRPLIAAGSAYQEISSLWSELVIVLPSLAPSCKRMVDRLVEGLQNDSGRHLWRLQVQLRTFA